MSDNEKGGRNHVAAFENELREVLEISDAMDCFDLVSADGDSCMQFRRLRSLYVLGVVNLMQMIDENGIELQKQLFALLRDS